jgi:N-glycosylation protein
MSRSVQIWVTSNLWWEKRDVHTKDRDGGHGHEPFSNGGLGASPGRSSAKLTEAINATWAEKNRRAYWKRWSGGGKWGGRRWDWKEVGLECVLPAGILYFIMAWAEQLRREWSVSKVY